MIVDWRERITLDLSVLAGKPVIKGTRVSVEQILEMLAAGWSEERLLAEYPRLRSEDIRACHAYAADAIKHERTYKLA
jgi:uncharacterized protein (DUF433 family)